MESSDCLETTLLLNNWANASELASLGENEKKKRLVTSLSLRLDSSVHSEQELNQRPLVASEGGLCGLAALQQGLGQTIATRSQLRTLSYETMRERITETYGWENNSEFTTSVKFAFNSLGIGLGGNLVAAA